MRIAIDARHLINRSRYTGTGQIAYYLIKYLTLLDDNNKYFIFCDKDNIFLPIITKGGKNIQIIDCRFSSHRIYKHVWQNIALPAYLKKKHIDIFFSTVNYGIPIIKSCIYVTSILDIIPLVYPKEYLQNIIKRLTYFFYLKNAIKRADHFITISNFSKYEIMRKLKIDKTKISVVYLATPDIFFTRHSETKINLDSIKKKYGITHKYILTIGSTEPRKNIHRLIEAYTRVSSSGSDEYQVVVVGKQWGQITSDQICEKDLLAKKKVIFTGYVPDEELSALYSGATIFAFPSLYEGFGIPPLEAMACGIPVIASNTSSIPEVAGDAALLFDPKNIEEITASIYKVLTDKKLRDDLVKRGFERVKYFSWEKAAKETLAVYNEVYNSMM